MTTIDIDAIRKREQAATPGPWGWRGHISNSVELRALHSGGLRIISTSRGEPCIGYTADEELVLLDNACKTCTDYLTKGGIGRGENPKCEKPENLDTVWTWHPEGFIRPINDWAKAEVLQWSKRMYRDDVKDTTHPDAEFIAHARTDVPALLAKVAELTAELDKTRAALTESRAQAATLADEIGRLTAENARLLAVADAAKTWRAQFAKPAATKAPRMAALIAAVDALPQGEACDCCYVDGHTRKCGRTANAETDVAPFGYLAVSATCKARIDGTAVTA